MIRSPFAKALVPAVLTGLAVLIQALTGSATKVEETTALIGIGSALLTYATLNGSVGISRVLKALNPAILTVVTVLAQALVYRDFNQVTLASAVTGVVAALLAYLVPNTPAVFATTRTVGRAR